MNKQLVNNVCSVLQDEGWPYTTGAVQTVVDQWFQKKEGLLNLFAKHPNWNNDTKQIVLTVPIDRKLDLSLVDSFCMWLVRSSQQDTKAKAEAFYRMFGSRNNYGAYLTAEQTEKINTDYPDVKIHKGLKTSRAMHKVCCYLGLDKIKGYESKYASCSDALSPQVTDTVFVISLNPIDYLLMSNGHSWTSCHSIKRSNDGCYRAGTVGYMLDDCSFIIYTVDSCAGDLERLPKLCRQVFCYKDLKLLQSRLYPQGCDHGAIAIYKQFRQIVQEVITSCLGIGNSWKIGAASGSYKHVFVKKEGAKLYPDWGYTEYRDTIKVSLHTSLLTSTTKENVTAVLVGEIPICINCGHLNQYDEDSLLCDQCDDDYDGGYDDDDEDYEDEDDD